MRSIKDILASATIFPLELELSTGKTFVVEHPDFTYVHPESGNLYLFGREGEGRYDIIIDPSHIVKVTPKGKPRPF